MNKIKGQIYVPNKDNPISEDDYDLILPQTTVDQVEGLPDDLKVKADLIDGKVPTEQLPAASTATLGAVKTGSNITNNSGTISVTSTNVKEALGINPIAADSNFILTKSTQSAINPSVSSGMPSSYGITVASVKAGIAAGTYKLQTILQLLVNMSHSHESVYRNGGNCVCDCDCNCQCSD